MMSKIDNEIHEVFGDFTKGIEWMDFEDVGVTAPYNKYYYAQDELYVITDIMIDTYYFVKAKSPAEAMQKYSDQMEEACHAGEWVTEDVE